MEFLFENPIIILIILGILSSLFQKMGKGSKDRQEKSKPFTETTTIPDIFRDIEEAFEDMQKGFEKETREKKDPVEKHGPPLPQMAKEAELEEKEQENEYLRALNKLERRKDKREEKEKAVKNETEQNAPPSLNVEDTVLNGIIWSEILGPPRSKNPRFPMKK